MTDIRRLLRPAVLAVVAAVLAVLGAVLIVRGVISDQPAPSTAHRFDQARS